MVVAVAPVRERRASAKAYLPLLLANMSWLSGWWKAKSPGVVVAAAPVREQRACAKAFLHRLMQTCLEATLGDVVLLRFVVSRL